MEIQAAGFTKYYNMQSGLAQMKLSAIACHHIDTRTDHLYQPLRAAIDHIGNSKSQQQLLLTKQNNPLFRSELKKSQFLINGLEQQKLKQSTMFPINMRLIQTNNPLKRMKARSRSYRAISVEETMGQPLNSKILKQELKVHPAKKKQIVYDYDPDSYQQTNQSYFPIGAMIPAPRDCYRQPARARSATYLDSFQGLANRVQRVESTTVQVQRKAPTSPTSNTSIKINELSTAHQLKPREIKSQKQIRQAKTPDFSSEYYQNCNKYTFNRGFKAVAREPNPQMSRRQADDNRQRSRGSSNYKYNLFSMMDQQANLNCQNGFCTKNQLVAPRIQRRW